MFSWAGGIVYNHDAQITMTHRSCCGGLTILSFQTTTWNSWTILSFALPMFSLAQAFTPGTKAVKDISFFHFSPP
jgi:hypothetical protein